MACCQGFGDSTVRMGTQPSAPLVAVTAQPSTNPLYIALAGLGVVLVAGVAIVLTRKGRNQEAVANEDPNWVFWRERKYPGAGARQEEAARQRRKAFYQARARAAEAGRKEGGSWWIPFSEYESASSRRRWGKRRSRKHRGRGCGCGRSSYRRRGCSRRRCGRGRSYRW
jgi:hypothetical protein